LGQLYKEKRSTRSRRRSSEYFNYRRKKIKAERGLNHRIGEGLKKNSVRIFLLVEKPVLKISSASPGEEEKVRNFISNGGRRKNAAS